MPRHRPYFEPHPESSPWGNDHLDFDGSAPRNSEADEVVKYARRGPFFSSRLDHVYSHLEVTFPETKT